MAIKLEIANEIAMIIMKACGCPDSGTGTFIPKKLAIMVGIVKTIVIEVKNFMTMFKLLEITEAKASIVPLKILL